MSCIVVALVTSLFVRIINNYAIKVELELRDRIATGVWCNGHVGGW